MGFVNNSDTKVGLFFITIYVIIFFVEWNGPDKPRFWISDVHFSDIWDWEFSDIYSNSKVASKFHWIVLGSTFPKWFKNIAKLIPLLLLPHQPWPEGFSPSIENIFGRADPTTRRWTSGAERTWKCPSGCGSAAGPSKRFRAAGWGTFSGAFIPTPSRATKTRTGSTRLELLKSGWTSKHILQFASYASSYIFTKL